MPDIIVSGGCCELTDERDDDDVDDIDPRTLGTFGGIGSEKSRVDERGLCGEDSDMSVSIASTSDG